MMISIVISQSSHLFVIHSFIHSSGPVAPLKEIVFRGCVFLLLVGAGRWGCMSGAVIGASVFARAHLHHIVVRTLIPSASSSSSQGGTCAPGFSDWVATLSDCGGLVCSYHPLFFIYR
eukprot:GHVU01020431.1.p2 GENE.GHVU01020431.1~~GHVU01020431.1.p2  ORF type:complete len:118 (-),score=3.19 GHVU01020431.1:198-551(-)